jgi:hypothetical protein
MAGTGRDRSCLDFFVTFCIKTKSKSKAWKGFQVITII